MYIHLIAFACVSSLCRLTDKKSVYHLMSDKPTSKKMRLEDVTTVGSRNTHRMEQPQGIVADTDGNMYVTTIDGIFRIDAKTEMMTQIAILAGSKGIVLNTEGSILVASQSRRSSTQMGNYVGYEWRCVDCRASPSLYLPCTY